MMIMKNTFFIGMQIVYNFKETHFTKVSLEQTKYV